MDAVDTAVFCNHCGARMPAICPDCASSNPPESRFCYRCGVALSYSGAPTTPYHSTPGHETRLKDIGSDLRILGRDVTAYSVPRIKSGSVSTARGAKVIGVAAGRRAKAAVPRIKSLAQRFKPYQPEPTAPSAIPTNYVVDTVGNQESTPLPRLTSDFAVVCPRCHRVSEPGAVFCFACGLPLDEGTSTVARTLAAVSASQPAGFWVRLWAWIIDFIVLSMVQIALIAAWPGFTEYFVDSPEFQFHWVDFLGFAIGASYYTVAVSVWSTTIGKRALRLYVLRPDGSRVGPGRALARYFAGILSWLLFGVGYLMIGLRGDKRGLHDLICDTSVVRQ